MLSGKLGPLAGEGGSWFRSESPSRQTAKAHAPQLTAALADYGQTVEFERHQLLSRHREEQHRQRQELKVPSPALAEVLEAHPDGQSHLLRKSPDLRRELSSLMLALNRRLSPNERSALHKGDVAQTAKSLGLTIERGVDIRMVQALGTQVQREILSQAQERFRFQPAPNLFPKR